MKIEIKLTPAQTEIAYWLLGCPAFCEIETTLEMFENESDLDDLAQKFLNCKIKNNILEMDNDPRIIDEMIENLDRYIKMAKESLVENVEIARECKTTNSLIKKLEMARQ